MVKVDKETCIGCGNCTAVCEEVFEIKDGKSYIKKGKENSQSPCIKQAIESCPTNSITL